MLKSFFVFVSTQTLKFIFENKFNSALNLARPGQASILLSMPGKILVGSVRYHGSLRSHWCIKGVGDTFSSVLFLPEVRKGRQNVICQQN